MADGPNPRVPPAGGGPPDRPLPLGARLLGAGVRGAQSVAGATGIDRTVEAATEEALVAAVQSEAVERALVRVLQGPVVEEAIQGAVESEALKRALLDALDSELVDEVWRRLLASEEAQQLVERIAEAPEVRAAVAAQGVGLVADIGSQIGRITRRLDGVVERIARTVLFRGRRTEPTESAGAVTRAAALGIDALIVNLTFSGLTALIALFGSLFEGTGNGVSDQAIVLGSSIWLLMSAIYLVGLWSLAGQTFGMRFLDIRLDHDGSRRVPLVQSIKRLIGLGIGFATLGIAFIGILLDDRRRGFLDRLGGTVVLYESPEERAAPWSRRSAELASSA
ncbi:MAG: RDD family protein [Solirubrobacterales bacterium]